jgi:CRP-like cAMP-binding protein
VKNVLFIFGQLTDRDVEWLTDQGARRDLSSGTTLIEAGEPIDHVYVILEGQLAVTARGGGELARLGAGEVVGEMSFVDASPPGADVTATGAARVLAIPRDRLEEHLSADPEFASRFFRAIAMMLADRLRKAQPPTEHATRLEGVLERDEVDPNVMETLTRAGERFDRMLKKVRDSAPPPQASA